MKMNIYDQAVLEGVATSFPQTEEIIENGKGKDFDPVIAEVFLDMRDEIAAIVNNQ